MVNLFSILRNSTPELGSKINFYKNFDRKYLQKVPALVEDKVVILNSYPTESEAACRTVVNSLKNNEFGYHDYYLRLSSNELEGEYIKVHAPVRRKGLGELLRLASIIEMKANNLNKITLFSMPEAVKFHRHYGFQPDVKSKINAGTILSEIISDDMYDDFTAQALKLLDKLYSKDNSLDEFNLFLAQYIDRCPVEDFPVFTKGINMILPAHKIKSNSDFYNERFEKHKINFQV